jgi:septum formation protein
LAAKHPGALILGSDQLVELEGARLDKPGTAEKAFAQLRAMSGKEHRLITSLAMILGSQTRIYTDVTTVRLKKLDDRTIEAYLRVDLPFDCAGSYKIERAGLSLVESIDSKDPSAVQGLPMLSLMRGFEEYKLAVSDFWEKP